MDTVDAGTYDEQLLDCWSAANTRVLMCVLENVLSKCSAAFQQCELRWRKHTKIKSRG
jgi:hypothetical protein